MDQKITISWQMNQPPCEPADWQKLSIDNKELMPDLADLNLNSAAQAYLTEAFRQNLTRFNGWKIDSNDGIQAASIYKRGVACELNGTRTEQIEASGCYDIELVKGTEALKSIINQSGQLLIIDQNVHECWPKIFAGDQDKVVVAVDELKKTLVTANSICQQAAAFPSKNWLIIGGGVLTDIAAFAAARKNIPAAFMPTTLLAMADACVGGKTGVNFPPYGKNQLGLFSFPTKVYIDCSWLKTLADRDLFGGANECLKHAILSGDQQLLTKIGELLQAKRDFGGVILDIIAIKAKIVSEDPAELGVRATLNLGHTLAHALEAWSHQHAPEDHIFHGEAVGVGLFFTLVLSEHLGFLDTSASTALQQTLLQSKTLIKKDSLEASLAKKLSDPTLFVGLLALIKKDKKSTATTGSSSNWILLSTMGQVHQPLPSKYLTGVEDDDLSQAWAKFIKQLP